MTSRVLAALLAVALLASAASAAGGSSPSARLQQQASLFKQGKWRAMYATFTPRFRRSCSYAKFATQQRRVRRELGTNFQLQGIRVRRATATRAIVAYRFVRNGKTIAAITLRDRDVYTRIGPSWYDELDRVSACA